MIKKNHINYHFEQKKCFEQSAVTIQKMIRGFLCRLKYENILLEIRELRTSFLIQESENISNVCLFYLGMTVKSSAILIQKATKRFIFRRKIFRLMRCYQAYLDEKTKIASNAIRKFILKHANKEKIS